MILDEIANTNWLFRRNLVGVIYSPVFVEDFTVRREGLLNRIARHGQEVKFPDDGCEELQASAAVLETPGINIFAGFGGNLTCGATVEHPKKDIVFIRMSGAGGGGARTGTRSRVGQRR